MLHFSRLRITGFKSFVEPTELPIEPGLTGIVGPNGCGKSNLVEALRWVMGENSAKQMRGGEMDDVIFAGSAQRPGRNVAQVSLDLDNVTRAAPACFGDEDELRVSRRIERAKGSTFRINGRAVRARDIQLLFADSSAGARSAAMVTQGQVAQLVSAKPAERRALLDEAAGITGLHVRRREAELRLQSADANLLRLDDVLATIEVQRQQLRKQAKQAARYRQVSAQIRALDSALVRRRRRLARAAEAAARDRLAAANGAATLAADAEAEAERRRSRSTDAVPEARRAESEAIALAQRLTVERDLLQAEEQRAVRDRDACRARLQRERDDLGRARALLADAAATQGRLDAERTRLQQARAGEDERIDAARAALAAATDAVAATEAESQALTERVATDRARRSALERARQEAATSHERLQARRRELETQRDQAVAELGRLPDLDAALAAEANALARSEAARARAEAAEAERPALVDAERAAEAAERTAAATLARLVAEERALGDLLRAGPSATGGTALLDQLSVRDGLETALAAVLGDDLLAPEDDGRAPAHWRRLPAYADDARPPLPPGVSALEVFADAHPALARRLALVGVIDDDADGDRLQATLAPGQTLVRRDGASWRWDGFRRTAGAPTPAAVRLRQRARLAELAAARPAAEADQVAAARRTAEARQAAAAGREREARQARIETERSLARARSAVADARSGRDRLEARRAAAEEALTALGPDLDGALHRAAEAEAECAALPRDDGAQATLDRVREQLSRLRADELRCRGELDTSSREAAGRARRLQAIDAELVAWGERLADATRQADTIAARETASAEELAALDDAPAALAARRTGLDEAVRDAERGREAAVAARTAAERELAEADGALRAAAQALAAAREERVRAEAVLQHATEALRSVEATIAERLQSAPEQTADLLADDGDGEDGDDGDPEERERRLERLRRERELMGPVNLRAEEEAAAIEAQVEELDRQRRDVVEAIGKLRRGIAELDREGRERLTAAFDEIDRHFQALFTRLFGGGRAHLAMVESDDALDAGLEIMASPPGKKLQRMSLLSGGEQTLTALALRFALFLTRPSPICVLDEVDAALDEANVGRFCALLDDIAAGGTRFLVITHHRLTMARMDRLFGVTMAERGVSQLVSVDLRAGEALRLRA